MCRKIAFLQDFTEGQNVPEMGPVFFGKFCSARIIVWNLNEMMWSVQNCSGPARNRKIWKFFRAAKKLEKFPKWRGFFREILLCSFH